MKKRMLPVVSLILLTAMLLSLTACGSASAASAAAETAAPAASASGVVDTIMTAGTTQTFSDEPVPEEDIRSILLAGLAAESAINQQPWFFAAVTDKDLMTEIAGSGGGMPSGGGMSSGFPSGGEKPEGFPGGEMPSGFPGGEMPEGFPGGEMPQGFPGGEMPEAPKDGQAPAKPQGGSKPQASAGGSTPSAPRGGAPAPSGGAKASLGDSPLAIIVYMNEGTSSPNPAFDCGLAVQNMYVAAASLGYGAKIVSSPTMALNGANHDEICEKLGVDKSLTAVAVLLIGRPDTAVDGTTGATTRSGLDEKTVIVG